MLYPEEDQNESFQDFVKPVLDMNKYNLSLAEIDKLQRSTLHTHYLLSNSIDKLRVTIANNTIASAKVDRLKTYLVDTCNRLEKQLPIDSEGDIFSRHEIIDHLIHFVNNPDIILPIELTVSQSQLKDLLRKQSIELKIFIFDMHMQLLDVLDPSSNHRIPGIYVAPDYLTQILNIQSNNVNINHANIIELNFQEINDNIFAIVPVLLGKEISNQTMRQQFTSENMTCDVFIHYKQDKTMIHSSINKERTELDSSISVMDHTIDDTERVSNIHWHIHEDIISNLNEDMKEIHVDHFGNQASVSPSQYVIRSRCDGVDSDFIKLEMEKERLEEEDRIKGMKEQRKRYHKEMLAEQFFETQKTNNNLFLNSLTVLSNLLETSFESSEYNMLDENVKKLFDFQKDDIYNNFDDASIEDNKELSDTLSNKDVKNVEELWGLLSPIKFSRDYLMSAELDKRVASDKALASSGSLIPFVIFKSSETNADKWQYKELCTQLATNKSISLLSNMLEVLIDAFVFPFGVLHVQHCINCSKHQLTTRHIPGSFDIACKDVLKHLDFNLPPMVMYANSNEAFESKMIPYPPIGCFEIIVRNYYDIKSKILYSRMNRKWYPDAKSLVQYWLSTNSQKHKLQRSSSFELTIYDSIYKKPIKDSQVIVYRIVVHSSRKYTFSKIDDHDNEKIDVAQDCMSMVFTSKGYSLALENIKYWTFKDIDMWFRKHGMNSKSCGAARDNGVIDAVSFLQKVNENALISWGIKNKDVLTRVLDGFEALHVQDVRHLFKKQRNKISLFDSQTFMDDDLRDKDVPLTPLTHAHATKSTYSRPSSAIKTRRVKGLPPQTKTNAHSFKYIQLEEVFREFTSSEGTIKSQDVLATPGSYLFQIESPYVESYTSPVFRVMEEIPSRFGFVLVMEPKLVRVYLLALIESKAAMGSFQYTAMTNYKKKMSLPNQNSVLCTLSNLHTKKKYVVKFEKMYPRDDAVSCDASIEVISTIQSNNISHYVNGNQVFMSSLSKFAYLKKPTIETSATFKDKTAREAHYTDYYPKPSPSKCSSDAIETITFEEFFISEAYLPPGVYLSHVDETIFTVRMDVVEDEDIGSYDPKRDAIFMSLHTDEVRFKDEPNLMPPKTKGVSDPMLTDDQFSKQVFNIIKAQSIDNELPKKIQYLIYREKDLVKERFERMSHAVATIQNWFYKIFESILRIIMITQDTSKLKGMALMIYNRRRNTNALKIQKVALRYISNQRYIQNLQKKKLLALILQRYYRGKRDRLLAFRWRQIQKDLDDENNRRMEVDLMSLEDCNILEMFYEVHRYKVKVIFWLGIRRKLKQLYQVYLKIKSREGGRGVEIPKVPTNPSTPEGISPGRHRDGDISRLTIGQKFDPSYQPPLKTPSSRPSEQSPSRVIHFSPTLDTVINDMGPLSNANSEQSPLPTTFTTNTEVNDMKLPYNSVSEQSDLHITQISPNAKRETHDANSSRFDLLRPSSESNTEEVGPNKTSSRPSSRPGNVSSPPQPSPSKSPVDRSSLHSDSNMTPTNNTAIEILSAESHQDDDVPTYRSRLKQKYPEDEETPKPLEELNNSPLRSSEVNATSPSIPEYEPVKASVYFDAMKFKSRSPSPRRSRQSSPVAESKHDTNAMESDDSDEDFVFRKPLRQKFPIDDATPLPPSRSSPLNRTNRKVTSSPLDKLFRNISRNSPSSSPPRSSPDSKTSSPYKSPFFNPQRKLPYGDNVLDEDTDDEYIFRKTLHQKFNSKRSQDDKHIETTNSSPKPVRRKKFQFMNE